MLIGALSDWKIVVFRIWSDAAQWLALIGVLKEALGYDGVHVTDVAALAPD